MKISLKKDFVYSLVGFLLVSAGCGANRQFSLEEKLAVNVTNSPNILGTYQSISDDGKKRVFEADVKGNKEIFLEFIGTDQRINISNSPAKDYEPRISADGKKVTFVSKRTGKKEIYMVNLVDIFYTKGLQSKENGNIESATLLFEQAVDIDPLHISSHHQLGCIYDERKDYDKAIREFSIVAELYTSEFLKFLAEEIKGQ